MGDEDKVRSNDWWHKEGDGEPPTFDQLQNMFNALFNIEQDRTFADNARFAEEARSMRVDECKCPYCGFVVFKTGRHVCPTLHVQVILRNGEVVGHTAKDEGAAPQDTVDRLWLAQQLRQLGVKW